MHLNPQGSDPLGVFVCLKNCYIEERSFLREAQMSNIFCEAIE